MDTSSITEVRRAVEKPHQRGVYAKLRALVDQGHLVFPAEVLKELVRGADPKPTRDDLPLEWAKAAEGTATSNPSLDTVKEVLARVPEVLDPEKTSGTEEAASFQLTRAVEAQSPGNGHSISTLDTR